MNPSESPMTSVSNRRKAENRSTEIIAPEILREKTVFLEIQDPRVKSTVERVLTKLKCIVYDKQIRGISYWITDKTSRTRLTGPMYSVIKEKNIPIITLESIPWATELVQYPVESKPSKGYVIVADCTKVCKPVFEEVRVAPEMYFGDTPRDYMISPFVPINRSYCPPPPSNAEKLIVDEMPNGPSGEGYCELCNQTFTDPIQHRKSKIHQAATRSPEWDKFEKSMSQLCK